MEATTIDVIKRLRSKDSSEVYEALKDVRKSYVRNFKKMQLLENHSVIPLLISLVEHPKYANITLSIIADACMERYWIEKVIENKGVESLVRIMNSLINDGIQNRACRALGNIAKYNKKFFKNINVSDLITNIVKFLSGTTESNCMQTAIRTLRILGNCPKTRDIIIRENGIIRLSKLLSSPDKCLILASIRAIADLTENCNSDYVAQLLDGDSLNVLVSLFSLTDNNVKLFVIKSLKNLSCHEKARSSLTKAGVVKVFSQVAIESDSSLEMKRLAILGLCNCVCYMHMWNSYGVSVEDGLKPLISALTISSLKEIHFKILNNLCPLVFGESTAENLISCDFIPILFQCLKNFIKYNEINHQKSTYCINALRIDTEYPSASSKQKRKSSLNIYDNEGKIKQINSSSCTNSDSSTSFKISSEVENSTTKFSLLNPTTYNRDCSPTSDYFSSSCSPDHSSKKSPSPSSDSAFSPSYYSDNSYSPCSSHEADIMQYSPVEMVSNDENSMYATITSNAVNNFGPEKDMLYSENVKPECGEMTLSPFLPLSDTKSDGITYLCNLNDSSDSEQCFSELEDTSYSCSKKRRKDALQLCGKKVKNLDLEEECADTEGDKKDDLCIEKFDAHFSGSNAIFTMDNLVLYLLGALSYHLEQTKNPILANKLNYSTLMTYIVCIKDPSPKAEKILLSLIKNKHFFEKLIQSGFFTDIEEMFIVYHNQIDCNQCKYIHSVHDNLFSALGKEVESEFGVGTLCHILCVSGKTAKSHALLAISKLISNKSALYKLLITANGLEILFEFLSELETMSILDFKCLCQLFQNIKKDNRGSINTCSTLKFNNNCVYKSDILDVTFIVDGDIKVNASRDKICKNSDYFNALLKGYFEEQYKNVITIPGISAETLRVIFHFLHGCCKNGYCANLKRIPFETLIELLCECEKYLLHDIKLFVESCLCYHLSPETVIKVYQCAKLHNSSALCYKAIEYILGLNVSTPKILNTANQDILLKCFKQLVLLGDDFCVFKDVRNLLTNLLQR